ncbi:hypothetical protein B0O80DRAFT_488479 [Mortierella sp. GBAus27b]|nr:hypothetical protein B0O80DRAFT_488479 [Mortierella sp. GBAus27b]
MSRFLRLWGAVTNVELDRTLVKSLGKEQAFKLQAFDMKVVGVCDDVICTNIRTSTVMGPTNYTPIPSEFLVYLKVSSPVQIDEGAHNPRRVVVLSTQHTCQTPTCPPMRSRTLSKLNTYPIRLIAIFELHHDSPGLVP